MSWEAVQWANKQRLRLPQEQFVLVQIANCADPDGCAFTWWKRREHWWTYLVDHTRLSRATIFRHLATIEELGLGRREKLVLGDGSVRFQMQLDLEKFVNMEAAEADAPQALDTQSHGETGETAASQSHAETESVSLVRLQERLLPESPDTPPNPLGERGEADKESSEEERREERKALRLWLDKFRETYPLPCSSVEALAADASQLTAEQRAQCQHGATGARAVYQRNPKRHGLVGPNRYVKSSPLWAEYGRFAPAAAMVPPPRRFVAAGSEEWRAFAVLYALIGHPMPQAKEQPDGRRGAEFLGELPPAGLVLARHAAAHGHVDKADWCFLYGEDRRLGHVNPPQVERDRAKIAAWRERVRECLGVALKPGLLLAPNPAEGASKYAVGLLVPELWPPAKGSTDPPLEPAGEKELAAFH